MSATILDPGSIRNIALTGNAGVGKTTLVERLLFASGVVKRMGTVEEGNTVSDWTEESKKQKHTLAPSFVHFDHEGHHVNVVDTPGLADFLGFALSVVSAVETVAVVVDAARGVEPVTRRIMNAAGERKIPRMLIVNKIDSPEADLGSLYAQLREAFGNECVAINLPAAGRSAVVNVFDEDHASEGETEFSSIEEAHTKVVEQVVEVDEGLMEQYLEGGAGGLDKEKVHDAFEQALREGHLVPVCFVSAKTGAGAAELLHVFASLCPSPTEGNPPALVKVKDGGNEEAYAVTPDAGKPVVAHFFRTTADPFVGKLGVFRVHQGTVKAKTELYIGESRKAVRIGHMFRLQGKEHVEVHEVGPGDIAAVSKIDEVKYDAVLHASGGETVRLVPVPLPRPMFGLAVELKNHADETKFSAAYHKLEEEDPCLKVDRIAATKQTVLRGLGELHLRVVLEKLKGQFGIEVTTSTPKTAYKETITTRAEGHHRHKKQTGGAGQFGEVYLTVEPLPTDHPTGFEFESAVVGGTVPRQYWPAVEKGVRQVLSDGAIAGYPISGVKVVLTDGKYHDVDSKEVAFVTAGRKAFIDAVQKAKPRLLEPFVSVEVTVPSRYMGDLAGHMSTKRGRVQETLMAGSDTCIVKAIAPLAELHNYSNELKSLTGGTGSYAMEYSHDEHVPSPIQAAVVAAYKPKAEEE